MSTLEDAVETLAGALDVLETRLDERLEELSDASEFAVATRRQARTAGAHAGAASKALGEAIGELRALLAADTAKTKG